MSNVKKQQSKGLADILGIPALGPGEMHAEVGSSFEKSTALIGQYVSMQIRKNVGTEAFMHYLTNGVQEVNVSKVVWGAVSALALV